jgi:predicted lipid-binding transport protein (Tim44 family)
MKTALWTMVLTAGLALAVVPVDVEAKRLGGARSSGMQRNAPDKPAQSTPAQPANNNAANSAQTPPAAAAPAAAGATAGAAAAASKRSWLGPIAGLAAGLGLAALFSHLGWGEGLANFVMLLLLAGAGFFLVRLLMRRFAGGGMAARQPALATAPASARAATPPPRFVDERPGMQREAVAPSVTIGSALKPALPVAAVGGTATAAALPADFDTPGFERLAKMLFIRLQAANDKADLDDLRQFTTPELFAALRLDLQDRGDAVQTTDVPKVDAQLVDYAEEDGRQIVSVRFTGLVREESGAPAEPFDEVWHVVKPADDSRPWAIAGIQQSQAQPQPQLH